MLLRCQGEGARWWGEEVSHFLFIDDTCFFVRLLRTK